MFRQMRIGRTDACISDLRLDAWLAQNLADQEARALRAHLSGCARCQSREALLREEREQFGAAHPELPAWLAPQSGDADLTQVAASKLRARGSAWLAGLAVAAACLLAFIALPRASVRTKGSDYLSFYVKRGEAVHRGRLGEQVRRGDRLRFAYTASSPRYLAILSLDGARRASVYHPATAQAERVEPGSEVLLPSAVELDEAPGEERIYAVFCDQPPQLERLRAELAAKQTRFAAPADCTLDQIVVVKEVRTP
jgi:hypothetical protein